MFAKRLEFGQGVGVVVFPAGLSLKRRKLFFFFSKCVAVVEACPRWIGVLAAVSLRLNYDQIKLHIRCIQFQVTP